MADAIEIKTKIDEVVEEIYKGKYKVNIEIPNQTVKVKDYCEADENAKYKCSMDAVSFQLKISKYKNNKEEIFKLDYNGIKMIETESGDKIKANVEELSIKMSN